MMLRRLFRAAAWSTLAAIVLLTVVPPTLRPVTPMPHGVEHAAAFFLCAMAFGFGYPEAERFLSVGALTFCAAIELSQLLVSGRHARLGDFIVDTVAALVGLMASSRLAVLAERAKAVTKPVDS